MKWTLTKWIAVVAAVGFGSAVAGWSQSPGSDLKSRLNDDLKRVYGEDTDKVVADVRQAKKSVAASSNDEESDDKADSMSNDLASGVVIRASEDELFLDVTPCRKQSRIISFHKPMRKISMGKVKCSGQEREFVRTEVRQN